jgi:iron complex outermembrane recepter protein
MSIVGRSPMYGVLLTAVLAAANPPPAFAQEAHSFRIAATNSTQAIQDFGAQSGIQILASAEQLEGKKLHEVSGTLSTDEGLKTLLEGTGLTHRYVGERTVALVKEDEQTSKAETKSGFWQRFRLAQTDKVESESDGASTGAEDDGLKLEEIVVSAQKRGDERLQDVPIPITVLDADKLASNSQVLLRDYAATIPGFNVSPNFAGNQNLTIRGISTGGLSTPTVGVLVDDLPYGSSATNGNAVPDIDPGDLARIEVLRGPQGTLYGANSMGGLMKFVTVDPSTAGYSGRIEVGTNSVHNGDEFGYMVRASSNIPLSDSLAVRLSGSVREDPGYIDNPALSKEGVNETRADTARLSAMWQPTDAVSLKLSALYQHTELDALHEALVQPGLGELQQNFLPNAGKSHQTVQAYGATLKAKLGDVDLTSATGYNVNEYDSSLDYSFAFGARVQQAFGAIAGAIYHGNSNIKKFSQELRASGSIGARIEWLAGGFYTHEDTPRFPRVEAVDVTTGGFLGEYYQFDGPTTFREYAVFADLTYQITDRFDVQIGGRESDIRVELSEARFAGPYAATIPNPVTPGAISNANAFTYLLTPRFKISPDLMLYARFASGYRPGGPNTVFSPGLPTQVEPDKTNNYEIGLKGEFLEHKLVVDASLYYIDWKDIQIQVRDPVSNFIYSTNGSGAKSEGVELAVTSMPLTGLTIGAWLTYDNAVLIETIPPGPSYGAAGDRLPFTSRRSGNLSVERSFALSDTVTGYVGGMVSYVGERLGQLTATPERQTFPSYTKTDLRAGVKYASWTVNAFVNNVTDERGLINGGVGYFYPAARIYITPRTVGLSVARTF